MPEQIKSKLSVKVLRIVLAVALVAGFLMLFPTLSGLTAEDILNYKPGYPFLTALILLALYCAKAIVQVIPLAVLYVPAGILFPTPVALLITALGLTCEMSIGYFVGRRAGAAKVMSLIEKRPRAGLFFDVVSKNGSTACFLTRLIPMPVPLDIVSMFFGASKLPYLRYIGFSLLGISAKAAAWVVAAESIDTPLSAQFLVPFSFCFLISGGAFVFYFIMDRRKKKAASQPKGTR